MDDVIRKYVERALELSNRNDSDLTDGDLAEIARELGLTDEDLARIGKSVQDSLSRGRGYLEHDMWDDAVREFEDASSLAPTSNEVRIALARALTSRYDTSEAAEDRERAVALARAVLITEPSNSEAFEVLRRFSAREVSAPSEKKSMAWPVFVVVVLGGVSLFVGVTIYSVVQDAIGDVEAPRPVPMVTVEQVVNSVESEAGSRDLDVTFSDYDGLEFEALRARLDNYPERSFFTLWGDFEVVGDFEFETITTRVTLLDSSGAKLETHEREAWESHEATLRKGDHGVFTMLLDGSPKAESVKVEVVRAESVPASGPYGEPKKIEPKWLNTPPEHLKLEIRERSSGFSQGILEGKGFFKATWEFRNVGTTPIRKLTYNLNFFDKKGNSIETKKKIVTFSSNPPLLGGSTSLEATTTTVSTAYDRYEIEVIEFE